MARLTPNSAAVVAKRLARPAALFAALAAITLCVIAVVDEWPRVSESVREASPLWLLVALALAGLAMLAIALAWGGCIRALEGDSPSRPTLIAWYFAGELGKYLPGGIWSVLGRSELARRGGLPRTLAYASVLLSLLTFYGAPVFPLALVALHPALVGWWRTKAERLLGRRVELVVPDLRAVIRLMLSYLPAWIGIGACTVVVAHGLGVGGSPLRLALASVAAWIVGFAAVPVPAGAGIRELVFVALAGLPAGVGVVVAVTARLCFMLVDGVGGALASVSVGLDSRRLPPTEAQPESNR